MTAKESDEKAKALGFTISQIEKQFGKGAIMKLGEAAKASQIPAIPTEIITLDRALGVGGIPRGRVIEIFGPEASGKTTLSLHMVAQTQKQKGVAAFIDAEHALDPDYSQIIGVNIDDLLISQPDSGEQALEIADMLVRSAAVDVVVIDSVAALVPRAELEGEMSDQQMGLQARLMSKALRKLTSSINKSKTTVIFINQIREKIGVMFGNPETTPGGRALKFYSSIRLDVRRLGTLKDGQETIGARTRVKVVKNKVAPPFKDAEFDILFSEGISRESSLIDVAVEQKVISKSGAWFSYKNEHIGQGRENARRFLKENPDIFKEIAEETKRSLGMIPSEPAP